MEAQAYSLTIAGKESLEIGVYKAIIFDNALELAFFRNGKLIKTASLAPDRASFYRTLKATKAKIKLICQRLDIDGSQLNYDTQSYIIPISAFNFTRPEHTDFKRCWALSNLRLLPARENLIKHNHLARPFQPALKI